MSPRGAAVGVAAAVVVLAATDPAHLERAADELAALARRRRLEVAGAGGLATRIGAELLDVDPVTAAAVVARG
jgi:ribosomal protein S10